MTNQPLPLEQIDSGPFAGIYTLTLEQPGKPVVVLDLSLIQELDAALARVPSSARGLVLRSASERVFVAGADLKAIQELDDDQLDRYLAYGSAVFGRLSQLPCPTVAAINGAALGGGLELAMHCDGLVAAPPAARDGQPGKPYPVGLPEAGLSICPGWGGTNLLPARMEPEAAISMTMSGTPMLFDKACEAGLFDAVAADSSSLLDEACRWLVAAERLAPLPRDGAPLRWVGRSSTAHPLVRPHTARQSLESLQRLQAADTQGPRAAVLAAVDAGLSRGWQAALETERRHLIRLRSTPAGREAIANFFAKATPRK
ncbi:MAG: enoyl-CoA hydratase/isomerase family protein [Phycisphaeraceae bacterium]|nr:enoyl-CoA hydratase/isomerase family protein [Phycisphaeraceae bacterium]